MYTIHQLDVPFLISFLQHIHLKSDHLSIFTDFIYISTHNGFMRKPFKKLPQIRKFNFYTRYL